MNLYGAEEFAHPGDCPGCQECEEPTEQDFCEMHPEDGTHERLNFADECAYCGVALATHDDNGSREAVKT